MGGRDTLPYERGNLAESVMQRWSNMAPEPGL